MLDADTEDEIENGFYYGSIPFQNQMRLRNASDLVHIIEITIYVLTASAFVYLICIISLVIGVYKNRPRFMVPWLIVEVFGIVSLTIIVFWLQDQKFVELIGGKLFYCKYNLLIGWQ